MIKNGKLQNITQRKKNKKQKKKLTTYERFTMNILRFVSAVYT